MNERASSELRELKIFPGFTEMAAGSALVCAGKTRVLCTASVQEGVPPFLRDTGRGWLTAEYAMLPGSTPQRKARDGVKKDGRGVEIGRLIGRSLRAACDLTRLGERTIYIDCDVLQADGGTRTAASWRCAWRCKSCWTRGASLIPPWCGRWRRCPWAS